MFVLTCEALWGKVGSLNGIAETGSESTQQNRGSHVGKGSNQTEKGVLIQNDWSGSHKQVTNQAGVLEGQAASTLHVDCVTNGRHKEVSIVVVKENRVINFNKRAAVFC